MSWQEKCEEVDVPRCLLNNQSHMDVQELGCATFGPNITIHWQRYTGLVTLKDQVSLLPAVTMLYETSDVPDLISTVSLVAGRPARIDAGTTPPPVNL
jgi:hypothetical protein